IEEVVDALQLTRALHPFTRCMTCNGRLAPVTRGRVAGLVPPRVYRRFRAFTRCRNCQRIYWRGTHYVRLRRMVARLRS
ncbi:MAG TPA: Mut7-C RNAse domain-containing protein, partial [Gemmatimonadales bacterium]|nr:Mut7-C RNAse domain-containing protein [Gemmatimonadales bacterium]